MLLFALLCSPLICFAVLSLDLLFDLLLCYACSAAIVFASAWLCLAVLNPAGFHGALLRFALFRFVLLGCHFRQP